jgi:hypothetical protein
VGALLQVRQESRTAGELATPALPEARDRNADYQAERLIEVPTTKLISKRDRALLAFMTGFAARRFLNR